MERAIIRNRCDDYIKSTIFSFSHLTCFENAMLFQRSLPRCVFGVIFDDFLLTFGTTLPPKNMKKTMPKYVKKRGCQKGTKRHPKRTREIFRANRCGKGTPKGDPGGVSSKGGSGRFRKVPGGSGRFRVVAGFHWALYGERKRGVDRL